jgi:chaperonin GroEL
MSNIIKEISSGTNAKEQLIEGVNICANVVSSTMGYRGRTVLIETDGNKNYPTKDGYDALQAIHLDNPLHNMACELLKEASQKTVDLAGDGTTATLVLAQAFVKFAYEEINKGKSPIDIKLQIEKSRDEVLARLQELAIPVTDKLIYDVAKTSANSDEEIAKIVTDAFLQAGENGAVAHFRSDTDDTYLERIEGTLVESGYSDDLFVNVFSDRTTVFDNAPLIILSEIKFKTVNQITPFLEFAAANQRELVIVSDMEFQVRDVLLKNKLKGALKVCHIMPPSFGQKRKDTLKDLALICGTQPITTLSGEDFRGRIADFLGTCKKIVVGKTDTIITPNEDEQISAKVQGQIDELKEVVASTSNNLEKKYCKDRISKLAGGVSIIKVGGVTDSELLEKLARVDDAVKAVYSAKEEGVLAGGGVALYECARLNLDPVTKIAIVAPLNRICENAGIDYDLNLQGYPFGYDVKNFQEVNMFDAGIVDCHKVIKNALVNSISVANTILLTDNVISLKRERSYE